MEGPGSTSMQGLLRLGAVLLGLALVGIPLPGVSAAIATEGGKIDVGRIDPGHESVHHRNVTNTGTSPLEVEVRIECPCEPFVSASPASFTLPPGARQMVKVQIDVPTDQDPGRIVHNIQYGQRASGGSGGTAVAAAQIPVEVDVRGARLYFDPPRHDGSVPVKFVNGHADDLDVVVNGTVDGGGVGRSFVADPFEARGGPAGAPIARESILLPLTEEDPMGIYTVTMWASWENETTGIAGISGPHTLEVAHGALVHLDDFRAQTAPTGLRFSGTLESLAPEALTSWLVIEATAPDGSRSVVEGPEVGLVTGERQDVAFEWTTDQGGRYEVIARAGYRTDSGVEGRSSSWPMVEAVAPAPADADDDPDPADEGPVPQGRNDPTLLALVALIGLGMGAGIAILARRGAGKK